MKNMKLFPKTFLHCISLMIGVVLIAFLLIYSFLPTFYKHYKQNEIDTEAKQLGQILQGLSSEELTSHITAFAMQRGYGYTATDENGEILCSAGTGIGFQFVGGDNSLNDDASFVIDIDYAQSSISFYTADDKRFFLSMEVSLQPIDDAVSVLILLLPVVLLVCVLLSAVVSWIYAKAIVKPIRSITDTTIKMKSLSSGAVCLTNRKDEIGILSDNINELYRKLLETISDLEKKIDEVSKAEQEKLDFLLLASHELKTPVTAVRGMVDGMLYNVGIYRDRDTYLRECQCVLKHLTDLICSILEASKFDTAAAAKNKKETDIGNFLKKLTAEYLIVAQSRNLNMVLSAENDFYAMIPAELVEKALSNVLSNAVKYTDAGKSIRIYMHERKVIIENECSPLSQEELLHIGEPFYHPAEKNRKNSDSTGLGLYFTDRILSVCEIDYTFLPYENGMRFVLNLEK